MTVAPAWIRRASGLALRTGPLVVLLAASAGLAGEAGEAGGLPWALELDPSATEITFELGATLHTVEGRFELAEGTVAFDPDRGEVSGRVVVDATSGDTGIDRRDRVMHEEVLESDRFPRIVLEPERIEVSERGSGTLRGVLHARITLHEGTHEVAIPIEARRVASGRGRVEGELEIPWVDWGLEDPSSFVLRVEKVLTARFVAVGALRERAP